MHPLLSLLPLHLPKLLLIPLTSMPHPIKLVLIPVISMPQSIILLIHPLGVRVSHLFLCQVVEHHQRAHKEGELTQMVVNFHLSMNLMMMMMLLNRQMNKFKKKPKYQRLNKDHLRVGPEEKIEFNEIEVRLRNSDQENGEGHDILRSPI
jgi:hypothetical protein